MQYFVLLTAATAAIAGLAWTLYRRRGDIGLLLGTAVLYYWSLYGAWYIVIDKTGGFSGKNYHYLEYKLFPVALDNDYLKTLIMYAGFIIVVQLTLLAALSRRRARVIPRLVLRHEPILLIGCLAGVASFFIIEDKLSAAWALNTSAYWYTRAETDQWYTLHQVLNRVALIPAAIGLATLMAGNRSRYFVNAAPRYAFPVYLALFVGMGAFTFVLGNKNEVFVGLLSGFLAYVASVRRVNWAKVALILLVGFWFLYA